MNIVPSISVCSNFQFKKCTQCQQDKTLADFSQKSTKADGSIRYEASCKLCKKKTDRIRNQRKKKLIKNKNKIKEDINFTYVFSLAKEGADLKGAINICMDQQKA